MRINKDIIAKLNPCKDRFDNFIKEYPDFDDHLREFILLDKITYSDKVWVFTRLATKMQNVKWSLMCASKVLYIFEEVFPDDKRPRDALKIAEKYLSGDVAEYAARSAAAAARSAAEYAAEYAAESAAWSAARSAASAARSAAAAAWSAAWSAAESAAEYAAESAARSAEYAARSEESAAASAAWSAAEYAARSAAEYAARSAAEEINLLLMLDAIEE